MDQKLRTLQRKAQTGDEQDIQRYINELERVVGGYEKTVTKLPVFVVLMEYFHEPGTEVLGVFLDQNVALDAAYKIGNIVIGRLLHGHSKGSSFEEVNEILEYNAIGTITLEVAELVL